MLLSTTIGRHMTLLDYKEVIDIISKAGFDAVDFSFNVDRKYCSNEISEQKHKEMFTNFRKIAEDKGLVFNQAHAPFPSSVSCNKRTEEIFGEITHAIKNASYLGVKNIVVHPVQHLTYAEEGVPEKLFEMNVDFYNRLKPYCEEYGVCVAVENMWQYVEKKVSHSTCSKPDEFIKYVDALDKRFFVACLDIGHAALVCEEPGDFIRKLGKERLKALHVHDVDGINDSHTLPYLGIVNWDKVTKALKEIGYEGDFTYEASYYISKNLPNELVFSATKHMAEIGRYLINKITN